MKSLLRRWLTISTISFLFNSFMTAYVHWIEKSKRILSVHKTDMIKNNNNAKSVIEYRWLYT